jgi:hypothetical protein
MPAEMTEAPMVDELADRAAVASLLLDASIALDDIARRISTTREGRQELSAEVSLWSRRLSSGADGAMDRLLA